MLAKAFETLLEKSGRKMKKTIIFTVIGTIMVVGVLGGIKGLQIGRMIARGEAFVPPPETVTAAAVKADTWETSLTAVGSLEAVQGVMVTAELSGKVVKIDFESGAKVRAGDLLVQQDISTETAQLRAAESELQLAQVNFERASKLLPDKVISQSDFDSTDARYKQARAQLDNIKAVIAKKTIRAPFSGRLGIRLINLGQVINEGEPIVSLQSLDPIYVNFLLPQQDVAKIDVGMPVRLTTDTLSNQTITGTITAINPEVDSTTRNIRVQATLENVQEKLRPGMFANVAVIMPQKKQVLAIPVTAVLYAPYSDSVFVVEDKSKAGQGESSGRAVRQQFVQLGEKRGDYVAVRSGLKPGETVVSTGVFKLRNGQSVVVDNRLSPEFKLNPRPNDA